MEEERQPALLIARRDGTVLERRDRHELIDGVACGRPCWTVLASQRGAEGLPCRPGCTGRLLAGHSGRAMRAIVHLRGERYELVCLPVRDEVFALLLPRTMPRNGWERVTPRERDVLCLLCEGLSTTAIARALGMSRATVRTHVEHMRTRFGVPNRAALVAECIRRGHVD
jgi:DNA-binding CsgD family transcriptional regulator